MEFCLSNIFDKQLVGKRLLGTKATPDECCEDWKDVEEYGEEAEPDDCQCEYCLDKDKFGKIIEKVTLGWDADHDPLIVLILEDGSTVDVYETDTMKLEDA